MVCWNQIFIEEFLSKKLFDVIAKSEAVSAFTEIASLFAILWIDVFE